MGVSLAVREEVGEDGGGGGGVRVPAVCIHCIFTERQTQSPRQKMMGRGRPGQDDENNDGSECT